MAGVRFVAKKDVPSVLDSAPRTFEKMWGRTPLLPTRGFRIVNLTAMGAPSEVSAKQLRELHIRVVPPEKTGG